jgi:hypothetical protein
VKLIEGTPPRRKRKPKSTPLDSYEPYLKLRSLILNGKMRPFQQVGILFDREDSDKLEMKWPWRTVAERIRNLVKELGLESDYKIVKYETDTPGVWFVRVDYVPPVSKAGGASNQSPPRKKVPEAHKSTSTR